MVSDDIQISDYVWKPLLKEVGSAGPVEPANASDAYLFSRYDDLVELLRSPACRPVSPKGFIERHANALNISVPNLLRFADAIIVFKDTDSHMEQRTNFIRYLSHLEDKWTPDQIENLVDCRFHGLETGQISNLAFDYIEPVFTQFVARSLGFEFETSRQVIDGVAPAWDAFRFLHRRSEIEAFEARLARSFQILSDAPRSAGFVPVGPRKSDGLIDEELFLATAIWGTSATLLQSSLYFLSQSLSLQNFLAEDPEKWDWFIEEVLRLRPSLSELGIRTTIRDTRLGGQEFKAGAQLYCAIERSGRDEARYPGHQFIDLSAARKPNLGFSFGGHFCVGKKFAKRMARTVLSRLMQTYRFEFVSAKRSRRIKIISLFDELNLHVRSV